MGKQILIVEDDSAIMDTLTMFLQYEGYQVHKARSVERALAALEQTCPDLVLLDYMLQDDTAEPVVELIRSKYGSSMAILLLTAADDPEGKARCIGADGVVSKPFELDVFLQCVHELLGRTSQRAARSKGVALTSPSLLHAQTQSDHSLVF